MQQLVVWTLDHQRHALPLAAVERVLLPVEVTSLPDAPPSVMGVIDVRGSLLPVYDMRQRLGLPQRAVRLSDRLVIARAAAGSIAFFADSVAGALDVPDDVIALAAPLHTAGACASGLARLADGMVLIDDLDRFLSLDDARRLQLALQLAA